MTTQLILGNSSVSINHHGATVTSWKNDGEEILFCSEKSVFDNKKAIRGGIPLVFPQFGPWKNGPQHGFARIKAWKLETAPAKTGDGGMTASFSLVDDDKTREMWDVRFMLLYTVTLWNYRLETKLTVKNTGSESFDFTTLMHTYFHVSDIDKARVVGLNGLEFTDKVHGGEKKEDREQVFVNENYDRIYKDCQVPVKLYPDGEGSSKCVTINHSNLPDIVVWNPWSEKAKQMSDFGDEEYKVMLCVEAGSVSKPVSIKPDNTLEFTQNIELSPNTNKL